MPESVVQHLSGYCSSRVGQRSHTEPEVEDKLELHDEVCMRSIQRKRKKQRGVPSKLQVFALDSVCGGFQQEAQMILIPLVCHGHGENTGLKALNA
jgi:hypothetical protein